MARAIVGLEVANDRGLRLELADHAANGEQTGRCEEGSAQLRKKRQSALLRAVRRLRLKNKSR